MALKLSRLNIFSNKFSTEELYELNSLTEILKYSKKVISSGLNETERLFKKYCPELNSDTEKENKCRLASYLYMTLLELDKEEEYGFDANFVVSSMLYGTLVYSETIKPSCDYSEYKDSIYVENIREHFRNEFEDLSNFVVAWLFMVAKYYEEEMIKSSKEN